jgi:hypothetical protein
MSNKCIAVREIVADWIKLHAVDRNWSVDESPTVDRPVVVSVVGIAEPLELPNDEQIGPSLKRTVEDWLARECRK